MQMHPANNPAPGLNSPPSETEAKSFNGLPSGPFDTAAATAHRRCNEIASEIGEWLEANNIPHAAKLSDALCVAQREYHDLKGLTGCFDVMPRRVA